MFEMKMHSALYFPGSNGFSEDPEPKDSDQLETKLNQPISTEEDQVAAEPLAAQEAAEAADDAVEETQEAVQKTKSEIMKEKSDEFKAAAEKEKEDPLEDMVPNSYTIFGNEIYNNHSGDQDVNSKRDRYVQRSLDYSQQWDTNIKEWYNRLMNALLEHKYFDVYMNQFKAKPVEKIRNMYKKYIQSQYEKQVWYNNDAKFDAVKGSLFAEWSDTDPARMIYEDLTKTKWTATETEHRHSYHVEADKRAISERSTAISAIENETEWLWKLRETIQAW